MNIHKKLDQVSIKDLLLILVFISLLILGIKYSQYLIQSISLIFKIIKPFIIGLVLCFIFSLPMKFYEDKLHIKDLEKEKTLCAILSIITVLVVIVGVFVIILPQLTDNIIMFVDYLPTGTKNFLEWSKEVLSQIHIPDNVLIELERISTDLFNSTVDQMKNILPSLLTKISSFSSSIVEIFMSFIIAIYMLFSKDLLLRQLKRVIKAFFNEEKEQQLLEIGKLINQTFSNFFTGQLIEAIIIGILCYIGCHLLDIPYPSINGIVIGITNMIPYVGPYIGGAISAFIIMLVSPMQALVFIVFCIILQQVESNLIYPHVVGNSIGLSPLWVLFAISVGGGLFGIVGMIFGLPVFSVIYELFKRIIHKKINAKKTLAD